MSKILLKVRKSDMTEWLLKGSKFLHQQPVLLYKYWSFNSNYESDSFSEL